MNKKEDVSPGLPEPRVWSIVSHLKSDSKPFITLQPLNMPDHPNILIFCTDEQRGDHLGCMGHPDVKTPNIDRIAAGGTLFRSCYSSCPICMPARGTMFTGQTNRVTGMPDNGFNLRKDLPTMPAALADAGYRTHAVGKLHLAGRGGRDIDGDEDFSEYPERRIYWDWPGRWEGACYKHFPDHYYGLQTVELAQGHVNYIYGDYATWLEENHPGAYAGYKCDNADPHPLAIPAELHYNTWIADRSIAFIKEVAKGGWRETSGQTSEEKDIDSNRQQSTATDSNRSPHSASRNSERESRINPVTPGSVAGAAPAPASPFFLWCSFPDPHEPFAAVKKWSDVYKDVDIQLPPQTLALSPDSRSRTMTEVGLGTEVIDPDLVKKSIHQTYGMESHVDEQIGRVLDCLDGLGIADNTVVIFIADHGDQLGEHGLFYKSVYPYDAHMHIPFIVKAPGGPKGKVVDDVVSMLDLVPTVMDLAGVPFPCDLPGETLAPVVAGDAEPERKNALVEIDRMGKPFGDHLPMRTLVTNDYKLVYYPKHNETMLFDRKNDPYEQKNLADAPELQPLILELFKQLQSELSRTEMPGLEVSPPLRITNDDTHMPSGTN